MKLTFIKTTKNPASQKGVTMIEALVALLLFSVGALGLVAIQLTSLSMSSDTQQRTLAIWKAQELVDRIRSNAAAQATYITAIGNTATGNLGTDTAASAFTCPAVPSPNCNSATCTAAELANFDVWEVLCDPSTGVANVTTNEAATVHGSSGLTQLEVILFRNPEDNDGDGTDDGTGDLELYFEWVSLESDANDNIANNNSDGSVGAANTVKASLCDNVDNTATGGSDDRLDIDSRLDVYCVRFR